MVALIVGGSRGIGAGIVDAFARAGATTLFTHTGQPQYAEQVHKMLEQLRADGCQVEAAVANACEPETATAVVEQATSGRTSASHRGLCEISRMCKSLWGTGRGGFFGGRSSAGRSAALALPVHHELGKVHQP